MSGKPPTLTQEQQIGLLFKQLMHAFRHDIDQRLRHHGGLSFAHVVTLGQVEETPGLPGAQLARRLFVTAQTLTGLLRRLEQDGHLLRRPHPHNRRADCWHLSPSGERQLREARGVMAPVVTQMLSQLAPAEVESLRDMLQRCVAGLEPALRAAPSREGA
jgi:DNA-binding MarR family transcriptional regulator